LRMMSERVESLVKDIDKVFEWCIDGGSDIVWFDSVYLLPDPPPQFGGDLFIFCGIPI
jgi:hypothetical protein